MGPYRLNLPSPATGLLRWRRFSRLCSLFQLPPTTLRGTLTWPSFPIFWTCRRITNKTSGIFVGSIDYQSLSNKITSFSPPIWWFFKIQCISFWDEMINSFSAISGLQEGTPSQLPFLVFLVFMHSPYIYSRVFTFFFLSLLLLISVGVGSKQREVGFADCYETSNKNPLKF